MMTQFFQVLKHLFSNNSISRCFMMTQFFQVLKLCSHSRNHANWFYDDSILSGTKTTVRCVYFNRGFMMTQFFQVLKQAFQRLPIFFCFMMTQFFQVLKRGYFIILVMYRFMMTQFFQVLKQQH